MKRKMLSRLMAASIAAVMAVGMTGCGGGDDANQPANNDQTAGGDTQANAGDQTTGGETKTETAEQGGDSEEQSTVAAADDGMPEIRIDQIGRAHV